MSIETIVESAITGELVTGNIDKPIKFAVTNEAIRALAKKLTGLKADTPNGYQLVKNGIADVRDLRVGVEKKRKELKEDAIRYGKLVDGEAKRITDALVAIEEPLKAEKEKADNAKELEKKQIAEAKQRALQDRIDALGLVGLWKNPIIVAEWTEEEYQTELALAKDAWETKLRKDAADAEEAKRAEEARQEEIRKEKEEIEKDRAELAQLKANAKKQKDEQDAAAKDERDKLDAERKIVEDNAKKQQDVLDAKEKELQVERDRINAERLASEKLEQDRLDEIKRAADEAEQARLQVIRDADEAKRLEALKPDAEKLKVLGDTLRLLAYPEMATDEGKECLRGIVHRINETAEYCNDCLS